MREAMQRDRGAVHQLLEEFVTETRNELFPTREACVAFYSQEENFQRLLRGEIGDNLMYKYRALASFFVWPEVCRVAMEATREMLHTRGAAAQVPHLDRFWDDFCRYVEHKHTHGTDREALLGRTVASLDYDVEGWIAAGMPTDVAAYRLDGRREFIFDLDPEAARELSGLLDVWTTSLRGLTKGVTRMRTTSLIRRCRAAPVGARPSAVSAAV
jgi:hypothetical protein